MKKIHIINIKPDGTKIALKTIENSNIEEYTLNKIEDFINDNEYFTGGESIVLDEQTEKDIIVFYAKKNHKINWFIDFDKIKMKNYFMAVNRSEIFFYAVGGYGSTGDLSCLQVVFKVIKMVLFFLKNFYKLFKILSYRKMERHTNRSRLFIVYVIGSSDKWNCGFISSNEFKLKGVVEFFIMRDLGYKKKNGEWIKK